jgi:L-fucose mutarotase
MLNHQLIHPKINEVLGRAGHYSTVLIADGNYPAYNARGPRSELVSLNLAPGVVTCTEVLKALVTAVPIQQAHTMQYQTSGPFALTADPPVWDHYRAVFKNAAVDLELTPIEQFKFYETVAEPEHVLTIQTGDQALYANLLLTIGVRTI